MTSFLFFIIKSIVNRLRIMFWVSFVDVEQVNDDWLDDLQEGFSWKL